MSHKDGTRIKLKAIKGLTVSEKTFHRAYVFQNAPLDEFSADYGHEHTKYRTIRDGEYSRRGGRNLVLASWSSLNVIRPADWVLNPQGYEMEKLTADLIEICENGFPFHIIATNRWNHAPELERDAVIETLKVIEKAGEPDSRYFDIAISEYRDPVADRSIHKRKGGKRWPKTVVLHKNGSYSGLNTHDEPLSLSVIAKYAYGKPSQWKPIAAANGITKWGPNEHLIGYKKYKHGGTITIPDPAITDIKPDVSPNILT